MLIGVQNVQANLRAGFTAARDMSSHGNGYGDVDIRNAINEGASTAPATRCPRAESSGAQARRSGGADEPAGQPQSSLR